MIRKIGDLEGKTPRKSALYLNPEEFSPVPVPVPISVVVMVVVDNEFVFTSVSTGLKQQLRRL